MQSFKEHLDEASALKFYNLLPKKVRHAINRFAHQDKYKAALAMYRELKKNKDIKQRNLPDNQIKGIAADFFKLNRREFEKILNRKTRYEAEEMVRLRKGKKEVKVPKHRVDFYLGQHYKIVETWIVPIDEEVEYITEGKTTASTYFEQVIVACANSKNLKALKAAPGYAEWLAAVDKKWKTDDKTVEKFRKLIRKIATSGNQAGQSSESTSALWKEHTKKGKDISKADVMLGKHQVSVKGPAARIMSGVKEESIATLYAAFETIDVTDLGLGLETMLKSFVSLVKTEGAEMTATALKKEDPKTLSAKNKKALNNLKKQATIKKDAEAIFKTAFKNGESAFAQAFAWEAMSGEKKFATKAGVADAMLVWPYTLKGVKWVPNLNLNHTYVTDVAKQMKFKADVKSGSMRKKGVGKTGYSISQTVALHMKTADDEFKDSIKESEIQTQKLENYLAEGKINEGKLKDMLKGVWERLKNAIKTTWTKLINAINGILDTLQVAIKGGMNTLLNEFELVPTVRVNTKIKF